MTSLTTYNFNTSQIRVLKREDHPWFVGKDVLDCLGVTGATGMHYAKLGADETSKVNRISLGLPSGNRWALSQRPSCIAG
ncbi:MAG: hypothetical protein KKC02_03625 [Gammaproteobacteria bacterium]|nr:hypothetical protein [Gammaproteobacteria bacterium]